MSQRPPGHRRTPGKTSSTAGLQRWLNGLGRNQRIGLVAGAPTALVAGVGIVLAAVLSGGTAKAAGDHHSSTTSGPSTSTTTTTPPPPAVAKTTCPLTGLPAPAARCRGGRLLAVKIGNSPRRGPDRAASTRPTSSTRSRPRVGSRGTWSCSRPVTPLIGPTRSVRWDDWNILQQYKHAVLAYSGGIQPWMTEAASLPWIYNANGSIEPTANAFYRYNSSTPPASLGGWPYTTTPRPRRSGGCFRRRRLPRRRSSASPRGSRPADPTRLPVSIPFSGASDVVWQWSRSARRSCASMAPRRTTIPPGISSTRPTS